MLECKPVGADHVSDVSVVAFCFQVSNFEDRFLQSCFYLGDLTRKGAGDKTIGLPRTDMVEAANADG